MDRNFSFTQHRTSIKQQLGRSEPGELIISGSQSILELEREVGALNVGCSARTTPVAACGPYPLLRFADLHGPLWTFHVYQRRFACLFGTIASHAAEFWTHEMRQRNHATSNPVNHFSALS